MPRPDTNPVRWGIMGTAKIARNSYLPAFAESGTNTLVAVASRSNTKAEDFAREFEIPKAYGSYEELLADPEVEAVYIPLPISMHCEWSIRSAAAGKAVLVEKPVAMNAEEARRMFKTFDAKNLLIAEAMMYSYHPLNRKAMELVRSGELGKLRMVRASFNASVNGSDNIRLQKATGGGALLDVGCYCVSLLRTATGEEPCEVQAMARVGTVDESVAAMLRFPSGAIGYLGCGLNTQFDCSYEISGEAGSILVRRGAMCAWPGERFTVEIFHGDEKEEITVDAANHYRLLIDDFANTLRTGTPMQHRFQDSIRNMEVIDQISESVVAMAHPSSI